MTTDPEFQAGTAPSGCDPCYVCGERCALIVQDEKTYTIMAGCAAQDNNRIKQGTKPDAVTAWNDAQVTGRREMKNKAGQDDKPLAHESE